MSVAAVSFADFASFSSSHVLSVLLAVVDSTARKGLERQKEHDKLWS